MRKSQLINLFKSFEGDPIVKIDSEDGKNHISGIIEEKVIQMSDNEILDRWLLLKMCKVMVKE